VGYAIRCTYYFRFNAAAVKLPAIIIDFWTFDCGRSLNIPFWFICIFLSRALYIIIVKYYHVIVHIVYSVPLSRSLLKNIPKLRIPEHPLVGAHGSDFDCFVTYCDSSVKCACCVVFDFCIAEYFPFSSFLQLKLTASIKVWTRILVNFVFSIISDFAVFVIRLWSLQQCAKWFRTDLYLLHVCFCCL